MSVCVRVRTCVCTCAPMWVRVRRSVPLHAHTGDRCAYMCVNVSFCGYECLVSLYMRVLGVLTCLCAFVYVCVHVRVRVSVCVCARVRVYSRFKLS